MGFRSPQARAEYDVAYEAGLRALPDPAETRDVPTTFGFVRVYRFGPAQGPPLVLLPGRAGTAMMWRPTIEALAERHPVYAVDLLGEPGRSTQTAPIRDAADQAAWLHAMLIELGLTGVHLVGVSFGGWLACNLAIRAPARLASCSLLDPAATLARFPAPLLLRTTLALLPVLSRWTRPDFLRWISGGTEIPRGDPVAEVISAGIRDFRISLPMPRLFSDEQLRSIRIPVLAIIAGRSVIHDPRAAYTRSALIPTVQAELWPTATHAISGQCAAEVNERVIRFIASTATAGRPAPE